MTWFINQSLLFIVIAFLLGLLVGYLWWGRQVRRIRSQETTTTPETAIAPLVAAAPAGSSKDGAETESASAAEALPAEPAAADPIIDEPAPAPVAVADPEPVLEPITEPVAEPITEPVAEVEPVVEPEPVAEVEPVVEPEPVAEVPAESVEDAPATVDDELVADVESAFAAVPVGQDAPRAEDDLARIEGIGPKIAAALKAAGITTYAALADAERSTVEDALADANLRFAPSIGSWGRQARLLADGDEAGFKELTDWLIAGREPTAKPVAAVPPAEPEATLAAEPVAESEPAPVAEVEPLVEPEPEPVVAAEPEPVVEPEPFVAAEPEPAPVVVTEPVVAAEPEPVAVAAVVDDGPPDNLQRIEGIGPKMSAALIAAGIRTYAKLAESDVDTLRDAIEAADLRFAPSIVTWARQARLLADGEEDAFKELTDWLIAGREPTAKPVASSDAGSV